MRLEDLKTSITLMTPMEYDRHIMDLRNSRYTEKVIHKKKSVKSTSSKKGSPRKKSMKKMSNVEVAQTLTKEQRANLVKELTGK